MKPRQLSPARLFGLELRAGRYTACWRLLSSKMQDEMIASVQVEGVRALSVLCHELTLRALRSREMVEVREITRISGAKVWRWCLTDAGLRVYEAGTRTKEYIARDF